MDFIFISVNGKTLFLEEVPATDVQTDTCTFFQGDLYYHSFVMDSPALRNLHINSEEVLPVVFAAKR